MTNMQKISTVTERPFAKAWGISSTLIYIARQCASLSKNPNADMCPVRCLKYVTRFTKIEHTKQY